MQDYVPRKIDINGNIDPVTVKQYDNNSRFLHVTISDSDLSDGNFDLTGCSTALYVQPENDDDPTHISYIDGTVADAEGGIVTFLIPGSVTQNVGVYICEIRIYQGDETNRPVISTKPFTLVVEKSIKNDSAIVATQSMSALDAKMVDIQAVKNQMAALVASPAGSGGDVGTEVRDARVGWDGTEYNSLGDAVRGQTSQLYESVVEIYDKNEGDEISITPMTGEFAITAEARAENYPNRTGYYFRITKGKKYKIHITGGSGSGFIRMGTANIPYTSYMNVTLYEPTKVGGSESNPVYDYEWTNTTDDVYLYVSVATAVATFGTTSDAGKPKGKLADVIEKTEGMELELISLAEKVDTESEKIDKIGFEELVETIDIISAQGITLTLASNGTIWNNVGEIVNHSYYRAINEPIPVESGKTYTFVNLYGDQYTHGQLMLYDSEMKNGLQVSVNRQPFEYTIPEGKSFIGMTMNQTDSATAIEDVAILGEVGTGKFKSDNILLSNTQVEQVIENIPDKSITIPKTDFAELVDIPNFEDDTNMVENVSWTEGGMRVANGTIASSEYTTSYIASDFIPVESGFKYRVYPNYGMTLYAIYFSDYKNDGVNVNFGWVNNGSFVDIEIPTGKTFVSFNCVYNHSNRISVMHRLSQYDDEKGISIPKLVIDVSNPLKGKTIVNFGDSIFGQARPPVDISTFLSTETGATVHNCGFGGCQMTKHPQEKYDAFSMYRIVDAIVSNDWSLQDNAKTQTGIPTYFSETIALLKTIDFSNVDIVTLGYGINDFNNGMQLRDGGTNSFNHFEYAMSYSIEKLLTTFPNLKIFVCTMTYGFSTDSNEDTDTYEHTSWIGTGGTTKYTEWIEMQKTVANKYHLPIIDNYYDLGINKFNKLKYFSASDGTHQALAGRKLIASHMAHELW